MEWSTKAQVDANTLRPREHGRRFPDDIFKYILLNEMYEFRLKFQWNVFLKSQ